MSTLCYLCRMTGWGILFPFYHKLVPAVVQTVTTLNAINFSFIFFPFLRCYYQWEPWLPAGVPGGAGVSRSLYCYPRLGHLWQSLSWLHPCPTDIGWYTEGIYIYPCLRLLVLWLVCSLCQWLRFWSELSPFVLTKTTTLKHHICSILTKIIRFLNATAVWYCVFAVGGSWLWVGATTHRGDLSVQQDRAHSVYDSQGQARPVG